MPFTEDSHGLTFLFFFFQAEDGIRDLTVTGVQTCALPILRRVRAGALGGRGARPADPLAHSLEHDKKHRDDEDPDASGDRKSTRLNSSHSQISYAVFCLKKKKKKTLTANLTKSKVTEPATH